MGDSHNDALRVDFDRQIKLEFHGSTVTTDAGLLAYRELDDALGLTSTAASGLHDTRTGQNTQHSLIALLRQSLYSRLAGYEDVNDAERLCLDPAAAVRADSGADRPFEPGLCLGLRLATPDRRVGTSSQCVPGAPGGPIAEAE